MPLAPKAHSEDERQQRIRANKRRYIARNRAKCAKSLKAWRAANPEKVKVQGRRYRERNPEKIHGMARPESRT
jgi:hypothetical protein